MLLLLIRQAALLFETEEKMIVMRKPESKGSRLKTVGELVLMGVMLAMLLVGLYLFFGVAFSMP